MPGYRVTVSTSDAIVPGGSARVRIVVVALDGAEAPSSVSAWIGTDYDADAMPLAASPLAGAAMAYDVLLPLPASIGADTAAWIRLELSDGTWLEAGYDSFRLGEL